MWCIGTVWHGVPRHSRAPHRGEPRGGDRAVEGGVIPLFVLGSWSDRNRSSSGVQLVSSSCSPVPVLVLVLTLPSHVGTPKDPATNLGTPRGSDGLISAW